MSRTEKRIIIIILLGFTYLFINQMPYSDEVKPKKSLFLVPNTVGDWEGHQAIKHDGDIPPLTDQYLYREYVDRNGQSVLLCIGYWGKFKHDANIFSGEHIDPGFLWDTVRKKDIIIEIKGKKYSMQEIVYAKNDDYISLIYWYQTNNGITTRRFKERLLHGIDAILNRQTNVVLIKIISKTHGLPYNVASAQEDFAINIIPQLTDILPFDR